MVIMNVASRYIDKQPKMRTQINLSITYIYIGIFLSNFSRLYYVHNYYLMN